MSASLGMLVRIARQAASPWVSLACLVAAAAMLAASLAAEAPVGWTIAAPFGAMFVNLVAALAVTPALRGQVGLLVFHLGLAILALALTLGRLTSLSGWVEVTEGLSLDANLVTYTAGPLHRFTLPNGAFVQGAFTVDYEPSMRRTVTRSTVALRGGQTAAVGDDRPLVVDGYRLYTTHNKGFAPLVSFQASDGQWRTGALHLPSYPLHDYKQGISWAPPGGDREVTVWLHLPKPIYDEAARWRFRKPEAAVLVVDDGNGRHELEPGEEIPVAGGRFRYEELRTWMGYLIDYDESRSFVVAAAGVAVGGLLWHGLARASGISRLVASPGANR